MTLLSNRSKISVWGIGRDNSLLVLERFFTKLFVIFIDGATIWRESVACGFNNSILLGKPLSCFHQIKRIMPIAIIKWTTTMMAEEFIVFDSYASDA